MNITIRSLTIADIKQIQHIATISWHDTYQDSIPLHIQTKFLQQAYSEEALQYRLENSHFFVAEIDGTIVGFANFSLITANRHVELGALYLLPDAKGKGIGTILLETGIEQIGNVQQVLVHVEKNNQSALRFYKQRGFMYIKEFDEKFYDHPLQTIQLILYVT